MAIGVFAGPLAARAVTDQREVDWPRFYARRLLVTDIAVIAFAVLIAQFLRFGFEPTAVAWHDVASVSAFSPVGISYVAVSAFLIVGWIVALRLSATGDSRLYGTGSTEYKRVIDATARFFGLLAIAAFLLRADLARGYIVMSLPIGLGLLLIGRWSWRRWLLRRREAGLFVDRVLLAGSLDSVTAIQRELARSRAHGYLVVGACVPDLDGAILPGTDIPLIGDLSRLDVSMRVADADTLVVTSSDELPPERIRRVSWSLEPGRHHLVVAPALTDMGGPRITMRPVAGLPLLHVETPRYEGLNRIAKRAFDIVGSLGLIVVLSPLLAAIAIVVRLSSPGRVLFRQERVGFKGARFRMLKFRSMGADAESRLSEVQDQATREGNEVMFKLREDPRVTRVGRQLRRRSLDELPQLFNVLAGSMSLVGPRPPLEGEVQSYENHVHRRFMVKPGMTGLWQVSGRSTLSWADTVRLDLYYVENWSVTGDLAILWRTARAVAGRRGAY